jgi:cell division protein FtsB
MANIPLGKLLDFISCAVQIKLDDPIYQYGVQASNEARGKNFKLAQRDGMGVLTNLKANARRSLWGKTLDFVSSPAFAFFLRFSTAAALFFIPGVGITLAAISFSITCVIQIYSICKDLHRHKQLTQLHLDTIALENELTEIHGGTKADRIFEKNFLASQKIKSDETMTTGASLFESMASYGLWIVNDLAAANYIGLGLNLLTSALSFKLFSSNENAWNKEMDKLKQYNNLLYQELAKHEDLPLKYEPGKLHYIGVSNAQDYLEVAREISKHVFSNASYAEQLTPQFITAKTNEYYNEQTAKVEQEVLSRG